MRPHRYKLLCAPLLMVGCGFVGLDLALIDHQGSTEVGLSSGGLGGGGPESKPAQGWGGATEEIEPPPDFEFDLQELPVCGTDCTRVGWSPTLLYDFEEGAGTTVFDESGVYPPVNLNLPSVGNVVWEETGLKIAEASLLISDVPANKVQLAVKESGEITIEAWVASSRAAQNGPARIFGMSSDIYNQNFMLGEDGGSYVTRLRTTETSLLGMPSLDSPSIVQPSLVHLVFTHHSDGTEAFYRDAKLVKTGERGGDFGNWDESFHIAVGSEFEIDVAERAWLGTLHLLAIYDRALLPVEVKQNFASPY